MTITITFEGLILTILAVLAAVLLVYLIILASNLIKTAKKANAILDDAKTISEIAADKAEKLDGIVEGLEEAAGEIVGTLKGNKNVISAATNVANAVSNLAGLVRNAEKKKDKKTATEENK